MDMQEPEVKFIFGQTWEFWAGFGVPHGQLPNLKPGEPFMDAPCYLAAAKPGAYQKPRREKFVPPPDFTPHPETKEVHWFVMDTPFTDEYDSSGIYQWMHNSLRENRKITLSKSDGSKKSCLIPGVWHFFHDLDDRVMRVRVYLQGKANEQFNVANYILSRRLQDVEPSGNRCEFLKEWRSRYQDAIAESCLYMTMFEIAIRGQKETVQEIQRQALELVRSKYEILAKIDLQLKNSQLEIESRNFKALVGKIAL